jgi:hypothetical protein
VRFQVGVVHLVAQLRRQFAVAAVLLADGLLVGDDAGPKGRYKLQVESLCIALSTAPGPVFSEKIVGFAELFPRDTTRSG